MLCGIPKGSVLGAILFLIYGGDLQRLIEEHGLHPNLYADDSQIYGNCRPSIYPEMQTRIKERIDFKVAVLVYKCLDGTAPPYLADGRWSTPLEQLTAACHFCFLAASL